MKTIGLIGGMSWESTAEYYRIINETVREKLGGAHSAKIVMYSMDFEEIEQLQFSEKWDEATNLLADVAKKLEESGAGLMLICTNLMHKTAGGVIANINIPLLHIIDATAEKVVSLNLKKVGLLGARATVKEDFYKGRLKEEFDIDAIIPNETDCGIVNDIIFNELCLGEIKNSSRGQLKMIIEKLITNGAQGIILGCTELPLLIKQEDCSVPVFDTTTIHAKAAVEYALKD